jgi:hypothetical protein
MLYIRIGARTAGQGLVTTAWKIDPCSSFDVLMETIPRYNLPDFKSTMPRK